MFMARISFIVLSLVQYKNSRKHDELYAPISFKFLSIMSQRWTIGKDTRLLLLFREGAVNTTDLNQKSIEAVRKSYFPQFPYRNLAPLFRKKLRKWNVETLLVGKQKAVQGEKKVSKYIFSCLLVLSLIFICLNNTLSAICNTEIKATVAQELPAEEFDDTFTRKKHNITKICQGQKEEGGDNSKSNNIYDSNKDLSYKNNNNKEGDNNNNNTSILVDKINKLAVKLETSKIGGTKNCVNLAVLMKPVVYSWLDETGRKKQAADFLEQSLPESNFKPSISSYGMNLEIGIVVPDFKFKKGHLIEASKNRP
jgi:hypothetical protein